MQTTPVKFPLQRTEAPPTTLSYANDPVLSNRTQLCLCIRHCILLVSHRFIFRKRREGRRQMWGLGKGWRSVEKNAFGFCHRSVISVPLAEFPPICLELNMPLVMSQCRCVRLGCSNKQSNDLSSVYTLETWLQVFKCQNITHIIFTLL